MSTQYGELQPLAAEICWQIWGTPPNFIRFHVLAALLHGTLVVGVSQTLQRWTEVPPIFGRAAITLGIGPHSSYHLFHAAATKLIVLIIYIQWNLGHLVPRGWEPAVVTLNCQLLSMNSANKTLLFVCFSIMCHFPCFHLYCLHFHCIVHVICIKLLLTCLTFSPSSCCQRPPLPKQGESRYICTMCHWLTDPAHGLKLVDGLWPQLQMSS